MKRLVPLILLACLLAASCYPGGPIIIPGEQPVINSFNASPQNISAGESSTLSWSVTGATSVSIDQGIGNVALTGTRIVSPVTTTIYTLTATSSAGSATATSQVVVSGGVPPPVPVPTPGYPPLINYFNANPPVIFVGGTTTLSWSVANATSVSIDNGIGAVGLVGTAPISPASSTTYTLTAYNGSGFSNSSVSVVVSGGGGFGVTSATAYVNPPSYTGGCPKTFDFSAVITANGPGTISYKWERSDGAMAPVQSLTFLGPGSQTVYTSWQLGASYSGWERVHILTPNDVISNQANFVLDCGAPFSVISATADVNPPDFTGACPKTFIFSAVITVSGPGIVTYRWERSDGAVGPIESIGFPAAGSQMVGTTWQLGASGRSYSAWARVRILSPNTGTSNAAHFTLTCL